MVGGFAPDATALLAARVVQGCGAALAAPAALALLATTFPAGPARTRAVGVYGAMAGLGSVVGLLLGGALTTYLSWRWVLFINVPIAAAVLIGTGVLVPGQTERGRLDVAGAVTATLGIGSLTLYMQVVRGYSPMHTGLAYLPFVSASAWPPAGSGHGCSARCPTAPSSRPG